MLQQVTDIILIGVEGVSGCRSATDSAPKYDNHPETCSCQYDLADRRDRGDVFTYERHAPVRSAGHMEANGGRRKRPHYDQRQVLAN